MAHNMLLNIIHKKLHLVIQYFNKISITICQCYHSTYVKNKFNNIQLMILDENCARLWKPKEYCIYSSLVVYLILSINNNHTLLCPSSVERMS